jgi:hypothetical protein
MSIKRSLLAALNTEPLGADKRFLRFDILIAQEGRRCIVWFAFFSPC